MENNLDPVITKDNPHVVASLWDEEDSGKYRFTGLSGDRPKLCKIEDPDCEACQ